MSFVEALIYTLCDSFMSSIFLPIKGYLAIYAIREFSIYPIKLFIIASLLGNILAILVNFLIGKFFLVALNGAIDLNNQKGSYAKFCLFMRKFNYMFLIFTAMPNFGAFMIIICSLARVRIVNIFTFSLISYIIYHIMFFTKIL